MLTASFFLSSCNKETYLRVPKIETVSVDIVGLEVIVTGEVLDDGNSGISLGVAYDLDQAPNLPCLALRLR